MTDRDDPGPLFLLAAALLAATLIAAVIVAINGSLADAGDDILPLLGALAAITALAGWYRERQGQADHEEQKRSLEQKLEEREQKIEEREAEAAKLKSEVEERQAEKSELKSEVEDRQDELGKERGLRARLQHAHKAEREWTRELRGQIMQLHREQGPLGHTSDVRKMVLQVALKLVEAEKGLLLSREDNDGDGALDLVCHLGFDGDPGESAVAQEFAGRVLTREETVREDDSSTLRAEKRTPADEEIHNLLAIPIFIQEDFHGVVVCVNRRGGFEELDDDVLLALGDHAGAVLENGRLHGELRTSYMSTVRMLSEAIEVKDPSVRLHSDEVANYVAAVANKLEIDPRRREELVIASLLHDVGKIGISERILLKPGALTPEERSTIELHPRIGFRLVEQVPSLDAIAPAVLHHHERFDGDGYPAGLAGEQIPLEARVICVADSFSAMTSDRPYRAALELDEACAELERCAGTQFDPQVVRLFVEAVRLCPPNREPDGLATALDDPELRARRGEGEHVLGFGPVGLTDNLTFLYSHRYMYDAVRAQAERSALQGRPFAVVLLELADLAELNASDGYAAGDAAIQDAARAVQRAASRAGGIACRHSGRRMALVTPETDAIAAEALAREIALDLEETGPRVVTGSAAWQTGDTGEQVVARARLALAVHEVAPPPPA